MDRAPAAGELPDASVVEVEALCCGTYLVAPGWFYRTRAGRSWRRALGLRVPREELLVSPVGAFLLKHSGERLLLVDTGLSRRATDRLTTDFGRMNAIFFRSMQAEPEETVASQLQGRGISPTDIRTVVMTHLHTDHASAIRDFPNAEFVCSSAEWAAATRRFPSFSGYARAHLPPRGAVRLIDFDREAEECPPFRSTVDLFGDGAVRLLYTPGHTPGHVSVLVKTTRRDTLLVGDAVYTLVNLRQRTPSFRTADDTLYMDSIDQLRAYVRENPEALLIPTHDASVWQRLLGEPLRGS